MMKRHLIVDLKVVYLPIVTNDHVNYNVHTFLAMLRGEFLKTPCKERLKGVFLTFQLPLISDTNLRVARIQQFSITF